MQWYETASKDGKYEAGTLIFRKGASTVMDSKILTLDATIKGLQAKQYLANPEAVADFSFQNVVHLIVKEGSGVTEIPGYTTEEEYTSDISTILASIGLSTMLKLYIGISPKPFCIFVHNEADYSRIIQPYKE